MPTPPLSDEKCREAMALLVKHGSVAAAARASGIDRTTLHSRISAAARRGFGPQQHDDGPSPADRREVQSADFWRNKAKKLQDDLTEAENLIGELSGLMARPLNPPPFLMPSNEGGTRKKSVGLLHISDIHAGEVVKADEVLGINAYDLEVCKRRLRRLFHATIEILPRWASDTVLSGVVVALNGDLISGSIHEELAETNALSSQQQAWFVADELASGIKALADRFGSIFVPVTPGNHGRQTQKPRSKGVALTSYDMAIGEMLRRHFADDRRVTIHLSTGRDAVIPILGWTAFITHGDGTLRGGRGFIGPGAPILRGTKMLEWGLAQVGIEFQICLTAHLHTSLNMGKVLSNGSVVGVSEYSHGLRGSPELPRQWLALVTERYPIRERCDILLEDPVKPQKPRIRLPMRTGPHEN